MNSPPTTHKKKINPLLLDFTFLIFSIIPLLDVIVLTMKTKLTIPILQRALRSKRTQIKRMRSQTLLFLGHRSLIKNKKQIAVINTLNLRIFWLLRRLEIVFIFSRLVLQILFQLQFGSSYQCEIYHRHKWNVIKSLHHIFSRKPVTMATI